MAAAQPRPLGSMPLDYCNKIPICAKGQKGGRVYLLSPQSSLHCDFHCTPAHTVCLGHGKPRCMGGDYFLSRLGVVIRGADLFLNIRVAPISTTTTVQVDERWMDAPMTRKLWLYVVRTLLTGPACDIVGFVRCLSVAFAFNRPFQTAYNPCNNLCLAYLPYRNSQEYAELRHP